MAKKPSSVFAPQPAETEIATEAPAVPAAAPTRRVKRAEADKPAHKVGRKTVTVLVPDLAHRQFKAMAAEQGKSVGDYLRELLNREFAQQGRPEIA